MDPNKYLKSGSLETSEGRIFTRGGPQSLLREALCAPHGLRVGYPAGMDLVLIHPEIPHNTGCAARLAAAPF